MSIPASDSFSPSLDTPPTPSFRTSSLLSLGASPLYRLRKHSSPSISNPCTPTRHQARQSPIMLFFNRSTTHHTNSSSSSFFPLRSSRRDDQGATDSPRARHFFDTLGKPMSRFEKGHSQSILGVIEPPLDSDTPPANSHTEQTIKNKKGRRDTLSLPMMVIPPIAENRSQVRTSSQTSSSPSVTLSSLDPTQQLDHGIGDPPLSPSEWPNVPSPSAESSTLELLTAQDASLPRSNESMRSWRQARKRSVPPRSSSYILASSPPPLVKLPALPTFLRGDRDLIEKPPIPLRSPARGVPVSKGYDSERLPYTPMTTRLDDNLGSPVTDLIKETSEDWATISV
jgi:hypothetical protein